MKVLIDIKHPAQVHCFKNLIKELKKRGHKVFVASRKKEMTNYLLDRYNIPYKSISTIGKGKIGLLIELIVRLTRTFFIILKFKPNVIVEEMGIIAPLGWLLRIPTLVFYDSDNATLTNKPAYFFSTKFITPEAFLYNFGKKQVRYQSYQSLAHLHPKRFSPNEKILNKAGIKPHEIFTIVRFVSWGASHDFGHKGMDLDFKREAIREFEKHGKVFITSEQELPEDLKKYQLTVKSEDIHHLIHFATLLYGESATMATEAACLGAHAIFLNNDKMGYPHEIQNKYGLIFNFIESQQDQEASIRKGVEILKDKDSKAKAMDKRKKLLKENIDLTEFMLEQVMQYAPR